MGDLVGMVKLVHVGMKLVGGVSEIYWGWGWVKLGYSGKKLAEILVKSVGLGMNE